MRVFGGTLAGADGHCKAVFVQPCCGAPLCAEKGIYFMALPRYIGRNPFQDDFMPMTQPVAAMPDHPLRYELSNELHARPFPTLQAPCQALFLAIKPAKDAAKRDRAADRAHLLALLDRFGATHPGPDATHYFGQLGRNRIKWESHTEFVTYTIFVDGVEERPFNPASFDVFPTDWLADAPGQRLTSALIRVEPFTEKPEDLLARAESWFVPESLAVSHVVDESGVIMGDFRIDSAGHSRFAVFLHPDTDARRAGRIVQRVTEIETYKTVSMLGLSKARELSSRMGELDGQLTALVADMTAETGQADDHLEGLLAISASLENLLAQSTFRFGATKAYEALVVQRIAVLRESRFEGRQTLAEFMQRRFDPAMRTVSSTQDRLRAMAERAKRAGDLLRTRVDVERQTQNQSLLESMDRRAALQLRLQRTVEGLSVVAISYYAVNLVIYMLAPFADDIGLGKAGLGALATPLVLLAVWAMLRRIHKTME